MIAGGTAYRTSAIAVGRRRGAASARPIAAVPASRRARWAPGHDVIDLRGIDRLVLHQRIRHQLELVAVLDQHRLGGAVAFIDDAAHLLIDLFRRFAGNAAGAGGGGATEEYLFLALVVQQRAHFFGEPPLRHHIAGYVGGTLDVVRRPGGDAVGAVDHLFGNATAEQRTDIADDMPATEAVAILFRQEHRYTERTATWNDAHLVDRIVLGHQAPNDGVPCLVVCGITLLGFRHHHRFAFGAHHDFVFRQLELRHCNGALVRAR